jgi:hypothetical protein
MDARAVRQASEGHVVRAAHLAVSVRPLVSDFPPKNHRLSMNKKLSIYE